MPAGVRGALVQRISARPDGPFNITWLTSESARLPLGRIRLRWEPAPTAGWDVSAYLGLATAEVPLGYWPRATEDWPRLIHPTIHEVHGLAPLSPSRPPPSNYRTMSPRTDDLHARPLHAEQAGAALPRDRCQGTER